MSVDLVLQTVSDLFASLHRTLICLDAGFNVVHASSEIAPAGVPAAELFGDALFGPGGSLRLALEAGETREGWRVGDGTHLPGHRASQVDRGDGAPDRRKRHASGSMSFQQHYTLGVTHDGATIAFMYAPANSVTGANPLEVPGQQSIRLSMREFETELSYSFRF